MKMRAIAEHLAPAGVMVFWSSLALAGTAFSGLDTEHIVAQLGKFHPLVLHFPIVMITAIPLVVTLSYFDFGEIWRPTIPYLVHAATLTALATLLLGLAAARSYPTLPTELIWHRNLTFVATILLTLLSVYFAYRRPHFSTRLPRLVLAYSLLIFALVAIGAHLGAEAVHGRIFILNNAPEGASDYR